LTQVTAVCGKATAVTATDIYGTAVSTHYIGSSACREIDGAACRVALVVFSAPNVHVRGRHDFHAAVVHGELKVLRGCVSDGARC
jgi:hypothetical protein